MITSVTLEFLQGRTMGGPLSLPGLIVWCHSRCSDSRLDEREDPRGEHPLPTTAFAMPPSPTARAATAQNAEIVPAK
jgi:hypothetical protein